RRARRARPARSGRPPPPGCPPRRGVGPGHLDRPDLRPSPGGDRPPAEGHGVSAEIIPSFFPLVRTARLEDVERIAWLEPPGFPDPWPRELLAYEVHHPMSLVLVAVWGEGLPAAGYASFRKGGGEAELLRLAVAPGERRRGVARALVSGGLERLRPAGIESC